MPQYYVLVMSVVLLAFVCTPSAFAVDDIWTVGRSIITDVYQKIVGISTLLAGLMSAVAVLGCKFSGGRQQRVDQAWDWLKRIWIAWAIINGIGAFIAYVAPCSPAWRHWSRNELRVLPLQHNNDKSRL